MLLTALAESIGHLGDISIGNLAGLRVEQRGSERVEVALAELRIAEGHRHRVVQKVLVEVASFQQVAINLVEHAKGLLVSLRGRLRAPGRVELRRLHQQILSLSIGELGLQFGGQLASGSLLEGRRAEQLLPVTIRHLHGIVFLEQGLQFGHVLAVAHAERLERAGARRFQLLHGLRQFETVDDFLASRSRDGRGVLKNGPANDRVALPLHGSRHAGVELTNLDDEILEIRVFVRVDARLIHAGHDAANRVIVRVILEQNVDARLLEHLAALPPEFVRLEQLSTLLRAECRGGLRLNLLGDFRSHALDESFFRVRLVGLGPDAPVQVVADVSQSLERDLILTEIGLHRVDGRGQLGREFLGAADELPGLLRLGENRGRIEHGSQIVHALVELVALLIEGSANRLPDMLDAEIAGGGGVKTGPALDDRFHGQFLRIVHGRTQVVLEGQFRGCGQFGKRLLNGLLIVGGAGNGHFLGSSISGSVGLGGEFIQLVEVTLGIWNLALKRGHLLEDGSRLLGVRGDVDEPFLDLVVGFINRLGHLPLGLLAGHVLLD